MFYMSGEYLPNFADKYLYEYVIVILGELALCCQQVLVLWWYMDFQDVIVNCISVAHGMTSKERPTVALNERETNYTYSIVISLYYDQSKLDFIKMCTYLPVPTRKNVEKILTKIFWLH